MPAIIGPALIPVLIDAVGKAVTRAAEKPEVPISTERKREAAAAVEHEVRQQIQRSPELQHITSTEPWYQKRSRWAAIITPLFAIVGPALAKYGLDLGPEETELAIVVCLGIGGVAGGWLSYRAGTATRPLFSNPE